MAGTVASAQDVIMVARLGCHVAAILLRVNMQWLTALSAAAWRR